jgi:hypothetical protein
VAWDDLVRRGMVNLGIVWVGVATVRLEMGFWGEVLRNY